MNLPKDVLILIESRSISPEWLPHLAEAYHAAGRQYVEWLLAGQWAQVNVTLATNTLEDQNAALARIVPGLEDLGYPSWYMRKPPGLRIRIKTQGGELTGRVATFFHELRHHEVITDSSRGLFEPETYQFGGVAASEAFLDFFSAFSSTVSRLLLRSTLTWQLSLLVIHALCGLMDLDRAEQWDIWCNMSLAGRVRRWTESERCASNAVHEKVLPGLMRLFEQTIREWAIEQNVPISAVAKLDHSIGLLAGRLRVVIENGELLFGLRRVMPFMIVFLWNQCGLSDQAQVSLVYHMERLLSPKSEGPPA